ncbi:MAG TPA: hypothetical protein VIH37_13380 [Candidatus Limnocylindrales bacterium]
MGVFRFLGKLLLAFLGAIFAFSLASLAAAAYMKPRMEDDANPEDDEIELAVVYDGRDFTSKASSFRGGRIVCWYAGLDVDLRGAQLDPTGAELDVFTLFGGTRIRVPGDWRVQMRGMSVFGGATGPDTDPLEPNAPVLRVRHRTVFSGLDVESSRGDELVLV